MNKYLKLGITIQIRLDEKKQRVSKLNKVPCDENIEYLSVM